MSKSADEARERRQRHGRKPTGVFNAAKCIEYLRLVNADITPEQGQEWLIAEQVYRYLKREERPKKTCGLWVCVKGHAWYYVSVKRKRKVDPNRCPECGRDPATFHLAWTEARNGNITDHRSKAEQWKPLPKHMEMAQ